MKKSYHVDISVLKYCNSYMSIRGCPLAKGGQTPKQTPSTQGQWSQESGWPRVLAFPHGPEQPHATNGSINELHSNPSYINLPSRGVAKMFFDYL